jgi:hypothetical protein
MKIEIFIKDDIVDEAIRKGIDMEIFRTALEQFARDMLREIRKGDL